MQSGHDGVQQGRKGLSRTLRFEVFKRDSFACQYCGRSPPEVILEVDHINPVAAGGQNELINLLTSCRDCNGGKGARILSDDSILAKQKMQLAELSDRREQTEMMVKWREGLRDIDGECVDKIEEVFIERTGSGFNDHGREYVRKWLKKHSFEDLLIAADDSIDTYFINAEIEEDRERSWEKAFSFTPRVASAKKRYANKPWMKDLFYIRAVARNRLRNVRDDIAINLLQQCYEADATIESLLYLAKNCRSWTQFRNALQDYIEMHAAESE